MDDLEADSGESVQRAAAAGTAAVIGLAIGGPVGAVLGSVSGPLLEPVMARVWDEVRADGRDRARTIMQTAADSLGDDAVDFENRLTANEQARLLGATALDAGMRTAWPPKVLALGKALAAGLSDDGARLDDEQLIISALADLEAPHARVLGLLVTRKWTRTFDSSMRNSRLVVVGLPERERPPNRYPEWASNQIGEALPNLAAIVPALLGTLHRHGLAVPRYDLSDVLGNLTAENDDGTFTIDTTGGPDEPTITWSATALGLKLHTLLRDAGIEDREDS
jgi:hypothetical protein